VQFDAVLLLSFGGPDGPDDVRPFLENVLRGRPVAPGRIDEVAGHYHRFGGRSPINDHNRALLDAMRAEFASHGRPRPLYWGNRHWSPYLADTVAQMRDDGVEQAVVFVTSAYSSYSSCRQYLDDLESARRHVGPGAPELHKLRPYFNHPGFVAPLADGLVAALATIGPGAIVLMSAHSLPSSMAATCDYEAQLLETGALVARAAGVPDDGWRLVFQSRSGPPTQPWLGPDVRDVIAELPAGTDVVVAPIGFVSDHMEVVYDLDTDAAGAAAARGIKFVRSPTPGTDPRFVHMICQLIAEIEDPENHRPEVSGGGTPARWPCRPGCCPPPSRRPPSPTP
jgi:protoporphyrin/coproporphyrin ferrochelatase